MATFFKYKERDDINKSMIDWSGLTKTISDNLIEEKQRRDKTKFELEEDQLTKLKAVEDFTQGTDPTMNQKMMEMAQNYKEYLVEQHYLMKNGLVSVNDTKLRKQGAMDTFNAINDVTKVYNEKMQTFIDKGGNVNEFMAENAARALNIANSTLIIDPKSGMGTFVATDESGNEIAIPAKAFNNVLNDTYERFDTTAAISDAMKNAGTWVNSPNAFTSISDLRQNPDYNKWKKGRIDMMLANDKTVVSAAADTALGMKPTFDAELVKNNPDSFFLAKNEGGKITYDVEGLREKVYNFLETELEIAIDRQVQRAQPPRPTEGERASKDTAKLIDDFVIRGEFSGLKAVLGNVASNIELSDDNKKLTLRVGNEIKTVDLTRPQRDVGVQIAGIINRDYAGSYRNMSRASLSGSVNQSVLSKDMYGNLRTVVAVDDKLIGDIQSALSPTSKDFAGDTVYLEPNFAAVTNNVAMAARQLGLDPRQVKVIGDDIMYGNTVLGNISEANATGIVTELQSLVKNNSAQQKTTSP